MEEIRHGKWIEYDNGVQTCSECGEEHEWQDYRASYCEDCGAKMDKEEKLGFDVQLYKEENINSKLLADEQSKLLGIKIEKSDYIQFTKNKNEFAFKCNDKDLLPDIFIHFLTIWKNQISLLNTMQNQYLAELRDALLPDLMSGKIQIQEV